MPPSAIFDLGEVSRDGLTIGATGAGETSHAGIKWVEAGPNYFLIVRNTGAGANDVTFEFPTVDDDLEVTTRVVSVPAGATMLIGPFPGTVRDNEQSVQWTGKVKMNHSSGTELKWQQAQFFPA